MTSVDVHATRSDQDGISHVPELTPYCSCLFAVALGETLALVVGSSVLRRLAFLDKMARRRTEAVLIIEDGSSGTT